jgi:hypothetical protein
MFVAIAPGGEPMHQAGLQSGNGPVTSTVKCYGCGVNWPIPSEPRPTAQTPILHPPLSSLDQRVEFLLQAADEQLASPATRQGTWRS